ATGLGEAFTDPGLSFGAGPIPGVIPQHAGGGAPVPSASEQAFGKPSAGRPTLVQGSSGPSVRELQARLDQRGEALAIDGAFGPAKAVRPPPVVNASKATLLAGGFADLGAYKTSGDGFNDGQLDSLLADYGAFWGVDVRALATPDAANVSAPGAGDSAGKGVA